MYDTQQAVQFAIDHETVWDRDVNGVWGVHLNDPPPWNRLLGPAHSRGPVSGTIVVDGNVAASWGEPRRADLTFSIAKTYLALLAGVAHEDRKSVVEGKGVSVRVVSGGRRILKK